MPSKHSPRAALVDIRDNIELAREFVAGIEFDAFCKDERTAYAVTRCLEIISEASRRLPDDLKARHPYIPWRAIAGAGNIYRHGYEAVEESALWDTVHRDLSPLFVAVETELCSFPEE